MLEIDPNDSAWFKGVDESGTEGYFPVPWFEMDEASREATALRDYDALELSVEAGTECEVIDRVGGWFQVSCSGAVGWIPCVSLDA